MVDVFRLYIDDRPGPQRPEPSMFNASFAYFNLYPSIYSSLLGFGRYLLVLYNDTSISLAYAIVDLLERAVLVRDTLVEVGANTTFYPWVSSGMYWLVTWSSSGVVNAGLVTNATPYVLSSFTISSTYSDKARVVYDPLTGIHAIAYVISRSEKDHGIYMVFLREATGRVEPWILPVTVQPVPLVPVNIIAIKGSIGTPSTLGLVALEGSNLVVYFVNFTYPELLSPVKGATPVEIPTQTATATGS